MRQGWRLLILVLALAISFGSGHVLRREIQPGGALKRHDAPNSIFGYLAFGAFKPLFLNYLWARADRLEREGRFWELIDVQERLQRLVPNDLQLRRRQIQLLAYGIAQSEPRDVRRWRYYRRVLRRLAQALEEHPRDFALREQRFHILFQLMAPDRHVNRQLKLSTGKDALMTALEEAVSLRHDFPDRALAWDMERSATEAACEWLLNHGRFHQGAELLDALAEMRSRFSTRFPKEEHRPGWDRAAARWADVLRRFTECVDWQQKPLPRLLDPSALEAVLDQVCVCLEDREGLLFDLDLVTLDAAIINVIHIRATGLCQSLLLSKKHGAALRFLPRINRIAHLAEGLIGPRMPYYSLAYVDLFKELVSLDRDRLEDSPAGGDSAALDRRWSETLLKMEQLVRDRAGRTDSFRERLIQARH